MCCTVFEILRWCKALVGTAASELSNSKLTLFCVPAVIRQVPAVNLHTFAARLGRYRQYRAPRAISTHNGRPRSFVACQKCYSSVAHQLWACYEEVKSPVFAPTSRTRVPLSILEICSVFVLVRTKQACFEVVTNHLEWWRPVRSVLHYDPGSPDRFTRQISDLFVHLSTACLIDSLTGSCTVLRCSVLV